jgi:hypothetical protein
MNSPARLCLAGCVTPPAIERIIPMPPRGGHNNTLEQAT